MPIGEILKLADSLTTIGLLVLAVVSLQRGIVVFPREVKEAKETRDRVIAERNKWQDIALKAMHLGENTVSLFKDRRDE